MTIDLKEKYSERIAKSCMMSGALKALEEITQEINSIVPMYADGQALLSKCIETATPDERTRLAALARLLDLHGNNLQAIARQLNKLLPERTPEGELEVLREVQKIEAAYKETHTPLATMYALAYIDAMPVNK